MPEALTLSFDPPAPLSPPRKRWTRAECAAIEATGVWDQQKLELIDGELIDKMGKNQPHVTALLTMMVWLQQVFGSDHVAVEAPVDVAPQDNPTNKPEPDLVVLKSPFKSFRSAPPQPGDLALVVEIADTTLRFDLTTKARLYARAGIPEYWVLDLNSRRMIVHRDPEGSVYRSVIASSESETVTPLMAPQAPFAIRSVFEE
jgi:Uma2 family endonuclease